MTTIDIEWKHTCGTVRPLHGMNLGAPITNMATSTSISKSLSCLEVPLTRMHDCPLNNPGMRLVDIPCIFPFFDADPSKPENYYFSQTDDYLKNCLEYGTKIMYRLGVSIEHSRNHYWTKPPEDYKKWAEICAQIIRHYNEGWANGFHWNIEYWEIWNEADTELPQLWDGTWSEFINFYIETSLILKNHFPHLKIGGPSMAKLNTGNGKAAREFLEGCHNAGAPLDFFSWHQYSDKPHKIIKSPAQAKALLEEFGYGSTELHLTEWHYHLGWGSDCDKPRAKLLGQMMVGPDSAAYLAAVLIGWQDTPLTMGHYYTGSSSSSGYALFEPLGIPTCGYYAFEYFNRLVRQSKRIQTSSSDPDTYVIATRNDNSMLVLASSFKTEQGEVQFNFEGLNIVADKCKIHIIDFEGVPKVITKEITFGKNSIAIEKTSGSALLLVEYNV
ncbi:MAG: hypothetical protein WCT05_07120 [Lentisphaeria bacterium]